MYGKKKKAKGYAEGGYVEKEDKDQMPMTKTASKPRAPKKGAMFGSQPAKPA